MKKLAVKLRTWGMQCWGKISRQSSYESKASAFLIGPTRSDPTSANQHCVPRDVEKLHVGFFILETILTKDPAFLFYPGDYLRDTQCLSPAAQAAYDRIMCEHMRSIPVARDRLNFFTKRLNEEEKSELLSVLVVKDEGLMIEWVTASIDKRKAYSESRRQNGGKRYAEHMQTICSAQEDENVIVNKDNYTTKLPQINEVFQYFCFKLNKKILLSKERGRLILTRLTEGRNVPEMKRAIDNFAKDDWADRHKFCDLVYVIGVRNKVDNLDKWLAGKTGTVGPVAALLHPKDCQECWGSGLINPPGGKPVTCWKKY